MAGHPSVKKRQKELLRKERQAEKLSRRDERRLKRGTTPDEEVVEASGIEGVPFPEPTPEPAPEPTPAQK